MSDDPDRIEQPIGPALASEIEAAGLAGKPFSWDAEGVTVGSEMAEDDVVTLMAVLLAHDPERPAPVPVPDRVTNADWRVGLLTWGEGGRLDELRARVEAARDSGSLEGRIAHERLEYANHVYRAELMQLKDAFGFSAADVDESLMRAAAVAAQSAGKE
jgi:hypothetical protein